MEYVLEKEVYYDYHDQCVNVNKRFSFTLVPLNGTEDEHTRRDKSQGIGKNNEYHQGCDKEKFFSFVLPYKFINMFLMEYEALYEKYDRADKYTH